MSHSSPVAMDANESRDVTLVATSPQSVADPALTVLNVSQNYYIRGGSDRYFFVLSDLLAEHGHRVIPFTSAQPENEATRWSKYFPRGVNFRRPGPLDLLRFIYSPRARRAMRRVIDEQQPDLAHLHIYYGQLTSSILAPLRDAGVPIVQTIHDFKLVCPVYSLLSHGKICEACEGKHFYRTVTNRCNRGSLARSTLSATESYVSRWLGSADYVDHFISVSNFQRDKLVQLGLPAEKITVVHNYKDTTGIASTATEGDYLFFFGRLEHLKGNFHAPGCRGTSPRGAHRPGRRWRRHGASSRHHPGTRLNERGTGRLCSRGATGVADSRQHRHDSPFTRLRQLSDEHTGVAGLRTPGDRQPYRRDSRVSRSSARRVVGHSGGQ